MPMLLEEEGGVWSLVHANTDFAIALRNYEEDGQAMQILAQAMTGGIEDVLAQQALIFEEPTAELMVELQVSFGATDEFLMADGLIRFVAQEGRTLLTALEDLGEFLLEAL